MVYTKRFAVAKRQGLNGASKILAVVAVAVSAVSVLFAAASFRASNSYKKEMEEAKTSSRTEIDALRAEASRLAKEKCSWRRHKSSSRFRTRVCGRVAGA